ncbi:MAG TPA: DUF2087 domain-containing protein [Jatrophihabitans sp.]|jgi:hypothetical protein
MHQLVGEAERRRILRAFIRPDGALRSMPRGGRKRQVVLEELVTVFEPGARYSEREVNAVLRSFHADVAALRRYLVDGELMDRANGQYWRTGGWIDPS